MILTKLRFTLNDNFTTALAAGAVNGTLAEPGPGVRTVVDTENVLSIVGGLLTTTNKTVPAYGDPVLSITLPSNVRTPGRIGIIKGFIRPGAGTYQLGFGRTAGEVTDGFTLLNTGVRLINRGIGYTGSFGSITYGLSYNVIVVTRTLGNFYFIKGGGGYVNTTLLYVIGISDFNTGVISLQNHTAAHTCDGVRIPTTLWLPTPLLSDGFGGTWPTTDGAGHAESTGLGSGGGGLTWTAALGTWGIAAGVASSSVLDASGISIAVATLPTADVFYSCVLGYSAGSCGVIVRYVDTANYTYVINDGTNVKLFEVTTAVPYPGTERGTAVKAPAAGARLIVDVSGAAARVYYNEALMFAYATLADTTAVKIGMITNNVNNTFNDAVAYSKGTGGEYNILDRYSRN